MNLFLFFSEMTKLFEDRALGIKYRLKLALLTKRTAKRSAGINTETLLR